MIAFYLKGAPNASFYKEKLFKAATCEEVENILNGLEF